MKNAIKLLTLMIAGVSMIFLNSCGKDEGTIITPVSIGFLTSTLTVQEDAGEQTVNVSFGAAVPIDASFTVDITGTAAYTDDYTTSPDGTSGSFTVDVAAGESSKTFSFTPVNNEDVDEERTVIFTISGAVDGVELGSDLVLTVTITDDEIPPVTIASLRADYVANGETSLTEGYIQGVVITEKSNITGKNIVVQDASNGILVRFAANNEAFDLGDELSIQLAGGTLTEFNGLVQVSGLELTAATELEAGTLPAVTAESITVAEFLTGEYQSRLVTVQDVAIQGADGEAVFGSFQSETFVNAAGAEFGTFVRGGSLLEGQVIPTGAGTATGVPSEFSGSYELVLRSVDDLDMTDIAALAVTATDTDFGQVATTTYSAVKEYPLSVASGTLQGDVTIEASADFEVSVDGGTTFGTSGVVSSADALAGVSVQVRFYANTGIDGVKDGTISFGSFGTAAVKVAVTGEETGNGGATTLLIKEDFDYGDSGDLATVATGTWEAHSGAGNGPVSYVANTNLTLAGYATTGVGGSVQILNASSEDVSRTFAKQTSGVVYASALVNISAKNTTGDYFFHMRDEGGAFQARVYVNDDGAGNLNFGVRSGDTVYGTTSFAYNTDYLIVTKYDIASGEAKLYVLSATSATEPTTPEAIATGGTSADVAQVAFRQGSNTPDASIDAIRVSTDWTGLFEQ